MALTLPIRSLRSVLRGGLFACGIFVVELGLMATFQATERAGFNLPESLIDAACCALTSGLLWQLLFVRHAGEVRVHGQAAESYSWLAIVFAALSAEYSIDRIVRAGDWITSPILSNLLDASSLTLTLVPIAIGLAWMQEAQLRATSPDTSEVLRASGAAFYGFAGAMTLVVLLQVGNFGANYLESGNADPAPSPESAASGESPRIPASSPILVPPRAQPAAGLLVRNAEFVGEALLLLAAAAALAGLGFPVRAIARRQREAIVAERWTDQLTRLPNRASFMDHVNAALQRAGQLPVEPLVVLVLDFDRYKLVSDTLGPEAGDEMLLEIAERLRVGVAGLHPSLDAFLARFRGDEFSVAIQGRDAPLAAMEFAVRLTALLRAPYLIKEKELISTAAVGIAVGTPGQEDANAMLRNAGVALLCAKRPGRGRIARFDREMHQTHARQLEIESALRKAIGTAQLSVAYQPIVSLATGEMVCAEALVRWRHPQIGVISPAEFIPIAEETGLIIELDQWVLRQACLQWQKWQQSEPQRAPKRVSVNLSRVQLSLPEALFLHVKDVLTQTGMPAHALQMEVTEREVMQDPQSARELMIQLKQLGISFAMDDFGTGTSSLSCLREFPFDTIKIDRSFIADLGKSPEVLALIHASVSLIQNLGLTSVAEGVETAQQVAVLQSLGCQYGQGYLFSRPVSGDELLAYRRTAATPERESLGLVAGQA